MRLRHWMYQEEGLGPEWRKLTRVCACVGWAVHGIIFEFEGGGRSGILLQNNGSPMTSLDDRDIASRPAVFWMDVQPGDYIVRVTGNHLRAEAPDYLCHTLNLMLASGRTLSFASQHAPWKGEGFSHTIPQSYLVNGLGFATRTDSADPIPGHGCHTYLGLATSIHLPIDQSRAGRLPLHCKKQLKMILLIAQRKENERTEAGDNEIGRDVWWSALGFLTGYDLLDFWWEANL